MDSKPYTLWRYIRWLTYIVGVVGGIVAASFLSVATQAYETVSEYSLNPNTTEQGRLMFTGWPTWLTANKQFTLSPTSTPVNTQFLTNNTALTYTIRSIIHSSSGKTDAVLAASVPYKNNVLQRCLIDVIEIELESGQRSAQQIARQKWGSVAKAYINCTVDTDTGPATLSLMTRYEHTSVERSRSFAIASPDDTAKASLALSEALLTWYSLALSFDVNQSNAQFGSDEDKVIKGYVELYRQCGIYNVTSLEYFQPHCYFESLNITGQHVYFRPDRRLSDLVHAPAGDTKRPLSGMWISLDSLAKVFYHTILTDLGHIDEKEPNLLVDPELVEYFTRNITRIIKDQEKRGNWWDLGRTGIGSAPITAQEAARLSFGVRPAVMAATYLCQVPRMKSLGTWVVAVLVNVFVLLSGTYEAFSLCKKGFSKWVESRKTTLPAKSEPLMSEAYESKAALLG
ncbi:hypothetical protein QBC34DRAFT_440480 [Podospora aff. communis PSN243]|uniref:Uncharacterized protein n=1 Tax=Podospora aff. communis PSN243 TaxID=3040156 RepID=A0AAV9GEQ1_9PEZI|nr:hypothetical protein QBC34DRAFT_440480 [Podospora aff. communis PSN243]